MVHHVQPPLFVENVYDALKAIVQQLGGAKVVGIKLWPHKGVDDARRQLLDCLNPERNEKLDPEQLLMLFRLGREADFHVAKHWFDAEAGYHASAPISPGDEREQLMREYIAAVDLQRKIVQRIERVSAMSPIGPRAVA